MEENEFLLNNGTSEESKNVKFTAIFASEIFLKNFIVFVSFYKCYIISCTEDNIGNKIGNSSTILNYVL